MANKRQKQAFWLFMSRRSSAERRKAYTLRLADDLAIINGAADDLADGVRDELRERIANGQAVRGQLL